jgi:hypothetical protein
MIKLQPSLELNSRLDLRLLFFSLNGEKNLNISMRWSSNLSQV